MDSQTDNKKSEENQSATNPRLSLFPAHQYRLCFDDTDDVGENSGAAGATEAARNDEQPEDVPAQEQPLLEQAEDVKEQPNTSEAPTAQHLLKRASIGSLEVSENEEEMEEEDADVTITQETASQVDNHELHTPANTQNGTTMAQIFAGNFYNHERRLENIKLYQPIIYKKLMEQKEADKKLKEAVLEEGGTLEDVKSLKQLVRNEGAPDVFDEPIEVDEDVEDPEDLPPLQTVLQNPNEQQKRKHLSQISSTIFDSYLSVQKAQKELAELQLQLSSNQSSYVLQKKQQDLHVFRQTFNRKVALELGRKKPRARFDYGPPPLLNSLMDLPQKEKIAILRQLYPVVASLELKKIKLEHTIAELEQKGQNAKEPKEQLDEVKKNIAKTYAHELQKKDHAFTMNRRSTRSSAGEKRPENRE